MERVEYAALRETVYRDTLPNGLQLYVLPRPDYGKQFAFFATHYGGMNTSLLDHNGCRIETPAGVAHYLEHKLFDTAEGSVTEKFAATGAVDNAFTAADITGYYFEGTTGFEENLKTLISFVTKPYFTDESVQKERSIITQEIRMCEDDPYNELYYKVLEMMYQGSPVCTRVAGTVESIEQITKEMLYQCHGTFYRAKNMVLCVAGCVDPERVYRIVSESLSDEVCERFNQVSEKETQFRGQCTEQYVQWSMPVSAPLFTIGIRGEVCEKGSCLRNRLIAELACDVLFGASSELYTRLYDEGLINDSFGGDYEFVPRASYLLISGESRDPARVRDELLLEAKHLAKEGIHPVLWKRLVRAAYGAMIRRLNSLEDTCIELAQTYFDEEDYLRFPELFQSIEKRDVEEFLNTWCTDERTVLAVVCPTEFE